MQNNLFKDAHAYAKAHRSEFATYHDAFKAGLVAVRNAAEKQDAVQTADQVFELPQENVEAARIMIEACGFKCTVGDLHLVELGNGLVAPKVRFTVHGKTPYIKVGVYRKGNAWGEVDVEAIKRGLVCSRCGHTLKDAVFVRNAITGELTAIGEGCARKIFGTLFYNATEQIKDWEIMGRNNSSGYPLTTAVATALSVVHDYGWTPTKEIFGGPVSSARRVRDVFVFSDTPESIKQYERAKQYRDQAEKLINGWAEIDPSSSFEINLQNLACHGTCDDRQLGIICAAVRHVFKQPDFVGTVGETLTVNVASVRIERGYRYNTYTIITENGDRLIANGRLDIDQNTKQISCKVKEHRVSYVGKKYNKVTQVKAVA